MPRRGSGVLFYKTNPRRVLLFLRDDKPQIPFPNHLDILGGEIESGETAEEAVVREMREELFDLRTGRPFELINPFLFQVYLDERGTYQNIYAAPADFEIEDLRLLEGQRLVWLEEVELEQVTLAFGFNRVVKELLKTVPGSV
jgi:8-oxo-dGTP diphosphatase